MKIIVFVSSLSSQPRCIKRIKAISDAGFDVEVYGYTRKFYDINNLPSNIIVHNWGQIESGSNRINTFRKSFVQIRKVVKQNKSAQFYAFGFIFSFILFVLKTRYIYEISDISYTYLNNSLLRNCLKFIDKLIIKKSKLTVLTSAGFERYLFKDKKCNNIIIQPNMVSNYFKKYERKTLLPKEKIIFSYVGAFRYPNTVFRFAKIIGEHYPNHEFHFYGDSRLTYMVEELSSKYNNVRYFGKYKSPEDLASIYDNIDVVVACYDTDKINERIAEPNKLYEAICFCKPIIVSENTYLSTRVNELQIGFSIDATQDSNIRQLIDKITIKELLRFSKKEYELSECDYMYSPDLLVKRIAELIS